MRKRELSGRRQKKRHIAAWLLAGASIALLVAWLRRRAATAPQPLADADSRFIDVDGLRTHYKRAGQGEPVLVLVHGSFLSLFSWRKVWEPLTHLGTVIAFDRPAFGLTERPLVVDAAHSPYSPEGQADFIVALLDKLNVERAVLVGSSAGGTTAMLAALRHPSRVQALVLVDAMVYSGYAVSEFPRWLRPVLRALRPVLTAQVRLMISLLFPKVVRSFWHDPARLSPEELARSRELLHVGPWARATWELIQASHALHLEQQLTQLTMPVLVITGEHDRTVPTEQSIRLAEALPAANLVVVPDSGHLPHEEAPEAFVQAVREFVAGQAQGYESPGSRS